MKNYFLLIATLITIGIGCKKDKNEKPVCRINRLITPAGKEIKITYNAEGKYAKIENGETETTNIPAYIPGSIIYTITNSSTGTLMRKIAIALNNSGMASSLKEEQYNSAGISTSLTSTVYEYNGTELMRRAVTISGRSIPNINTYSWTNGNLTSSRDDITTADFEYYSDKPIQQGDWLSIVGLTNIGFDYTMVIKNKNLIKNLSGNPIAYSFDAEGKINAIYENGNLLYNIEYECE